MTAIKRWLAVRRWRLLWAAVALVAIRIAGAAALRFAGGAAGGLPAAALTACDVVIVALAVIAAIAFVQYGRIYRARVPTE